MRGISRNRGWMHAVVPLGGVIALSYAGIVGAAASSLREPGDDDPPIPPPRPIARPVRPVPAATPTPVAIPAGSPRVNAPAAAGGRPVASTPRVGRSNTAPLATAIPRADIHVQRSQVDIAGVPSGETPMPISLQGALYGAITGNPDLVALRQNNPASAEAVEVARHFPTTLNPTLWIDFRPIVLIPGETFVGSGGGAGARLKNPYAFGKPYIYISLRQPLELGHQTTHRYEMAKAAFNQQQWTVFQAEMLAIVQTYRFFETAAYRREKLRVAETLADFNDRLLASLHKRLEANQVTAADVVLAEVETQATRQLVESAKQDYATALTDLRNQIGLPETADTAIPLGEFVLPRAIPPLDDEELASLALQSRPEIHIARAQVAGAEAAVKLANGDRIPSPVVGPQYEIDEVGVQYLGFVYVTPLPTLNNGKPLLRQRVAERNRAAVALREVEKRTVGQVKAAVAKWNQSNQLVARTAGLTASLKQQVQSLDKLFNAGQADLTKLLQARQRLIQLENSELDAVWQATQAQADLLTALGAPALINALQQSEQRAESTAGSPGTTRDDSEPAAIADPTPTRPAPATPSPTLPRR